MDTVSAFGPWKSSDYETTLYLSQGSLRAETNSERGLIHFASNQFKWGVRGEDLPQQSLIDKVTTLGHTKLVVFYYPKENPTELWIFEASNKTAGPQIYQGKVHIREAEKSQDLLMKGGKDSGLSQKGLKSYKDALTNFGTALKLELKLEDEKKGSAEDLARAIDHFEKQKNLFNLKHIAPLCLPNGEAKQRFSTEVTSYEHEQNIFKSFEDLVDVQEDFSPHHHLMSALVYENKKEFLLAMKEYLALSRGNPSVHTCFEKAYGLFEVACKNTPVLLDLKKEVRGIFEKSLSLFNQAIAKAPTCFICFSVSEKDVGSWLENILVPDLQRVGVVPQFCFKDLQCGADLDNFQECARYTDLAIIAFTPELKKIYKERIENPTGLALEIKVIKGRFRDPDKKDTIFPIYLKGDTLEESCPTAYFESIFGTKFSPFTETTGSIEFNYFLNIFDLLGATRGFSREESRKVRDSFLNDFKIIFQKKIEKN